MEDGGKCSKNLFKKIIFAFCWCHWQIITHFTFTLFIFRIDKVYCKHTKCTVDTESKCTHTHSTHLCQLQDQWLISFEAPAFLSSFSSLYLQHLLCLSFLSPRIVDGLAAHSVLLTAHVKRQGGTRPNALHPTPVLTFTLTPPSCYISLPPHRLECIYLSNPCIHCPL